MYFPSVRGMPITLTIQSSNRYVSPISHFIDRPTTPARLISIKAYLESFNRLGEINTDTEWKTSILEKHGQALFVKDSVPLSPLVAPASQEICHIHGTDLSGHVTLSFVDAAEVISKGWGERHRLSGTDWVHLGFTMLYVPNTVEETEILINIFQAGIDYMKSG